MRFWPFGKKNKASKSLSDEIGDYTGTHEGLNNLAAIIRGDRLDAVTSQSLVRAYGQVPTLSAAVNKVATSIACNEWRVAQAPADFNEQQRRRLLLSLSASRAKDWHEQRRHMKRLFDESKLVEVDGHPALSVLQRGNAQLTGLSNRQLLSELLELVGQAYIIFSRRDDRGQPIDLWVVPEFMASELEGGRLQVNNVEGLGVVDRRDWRKIRIPHPINPYDQSLGICTALATELQIDEFAAKTLAYLLYNKAIPDVIISFKNVKRERLKNKEQYWLEKIQGFRRRGIPFFSNDEIEIHQLAAQFKDIQLADLRRLTQRIVRETIGIPPEILGNIENSNRATIRNATAIFARWVLEPRLAFLEEQYNRYLMPQFEDGARYVLYYISPVPADREHQLAVMKAFPNEFTKNEARELAGYTPRFGDDEMIESTPTPAPANNNQDDDVNQRLSEVA